MPLRLPLAWVTGRACVRGPDSRSPLCLVSLDQSAAAGDDDGIPEGREAAARKIGIPAAALLGGPAYPAGLPTRTPTPPSSSKDAEGAVSESEIEPWRIMGCATMKLADRDEGRLAEPCAEPLGRPLSIHLAPRGAQCQG